MASILPTLYPGTLDDAPSSLAGAYTYGITLHAGLASLQVRRQRGIFRLHRARRLFAPQARSIQAAMTPGVVGGAAVLRARPPF